MIKICELCSVEFEAKNENKRFCSQSCSSKFVWNDPKKREFILNGLKKSWSDDRKRNNIK